MFGANLWTGILFIVAAAASAVLIIATIFTIFYQRFFYNARYRRAYDPSWRPGCIVVIPCKGTPKDLQRNLASFLELDYPDYRVIYTVESQSDPAVPVIQSVIAGSDRASMVVAGLSEKCAQKNFNMLAAIEAHPDAEVYVFADADIGPGADWLAELVLPLSSEKVVATTGFRWLYSARGRTAEQIHSFMNNLLYVVWTFASFVSGIGLWGGSMAIRRRDFEAMGVARRWAETAVDDMSLSQIVMKHGKRAVLVPACVTHTDDTIDSVRAGIRWFERQCMFLKAYNPLTWTAVIPAVVAMLFLQVWLFGALALSKCSLERFIGIGGGASVLFFAGIAVVTLLFPLLGSNPTYAKFVIVHPFSAFAMIIGVIRTAFTNTITWAGVKYKLTVTGKVASVNRPTQ
jgi:cellulose synthase/poly-beta-1,6-N-acetylglucosamine synthase-like glycosyltransferase